MRHILGPLVKAFCDVRVKPRRLDADESVEPPDPSFADEFDVPQEYAVLVFDVRRAAVSLPFQVHLLEGLVEGGLVTFSNACFEFADVVPEDAQHSSLTHLPKFFQPSPRPFEGCCCGALRAGTSSPPLSDAMMR